MGRRGLSSPFAGTRVARVLFPSLLGAALATSTLQAANDVAGSLVTVNDNGAWSWFEDERAVVDQAAGKIIVSSVANGAGTGGAARNGDVEVNSWTIATGAVSQFTLSDNLQADDHNSAGLWIRPDGRYVALYSRHSSDNLTRYRVSTTAGSIASWSSESQFDNGTGTTYSNLHYLPNDNGGAGRLYNFTRTVGWDPNILVSSNHGSTWTYGGRLLAEGGTSDRPYARYFSNGDKIHFITTERHPRNFNNSIFHGYIKDGVLYDSVGTVKDANLFDGTAVAPNGTNLTTIFATGTSFGGTPMNRAWTIDVAIDAGGNPYAIFQARANGNTSDHRFFYARFNGSTWNVNQLARAGGFLYAAEDDYTGLAALDPHNPNRLFISSKIDPRDNSNLAHYEIFEGVTANGGVNWSWTPITFNSTVDNLRPIVPKWDGVNTALLWMRGNYSTYTSYNLDIVGLTQFSPLASTGLGDLDRDGDTDLDDFSQYLSGLNGNLTQLTPDEAYRKGDLNGDFANNYIDFRLFKEAYDLVHGAGALARAMQVPEPGAWALMLLAGSVACKVRRRRVLASALTGLICVVVTSSSHAVTFLAVDFNDRTVADANNTPVGFSPFTLTGTDLVPSSTGMVNGYTLTLTAVNSSGNPAGMIDDRDRDTPTTTPSLAQLYDDLIFAQTSTGTGGGFDLAINSAGQLAANTTYSVSLYAFDSGSTGSGPRTADWLDGNNGNSLITTASHVGANLPTSNDQYKFTGNARTDGLGNLLLRGRAVTNNIAVHLNGFEINTGTQPTELTLEVNKTTGVVRILNEQSVSFNMNFYEIRSTLGLLNPEGWFSLDDAEGGDPIGTGWDEGLNNTSAVLTEVRLNSVTTFLPGNAANLGNALITGANPDVQFRYGGPADTSLRFGIVKYVEGTVAGDYNRNGVVDAADYAVWRDTFGQSVPGLPADGDGDGQVDDDDFNVWREHFGQSFAGGSTIVTTSSLLPVPELSAILLVVPALVSFTVCRRRH